MENTKEINQTTTCGYCGNEIAENESGTLTIKNKDKKTIDKINICNACIKRLHLKIALSKMSKEDVESLDDFLSRKKK